MKRNSVSLVFTIFLAVGVILLIVAGILTYNTRQFEAKAIKTSGKVVDLVQKNSRSNSRNSSTYSPVIVYTDDKGGQHRYIPSFSSNPPAYDIGEAVDIYYDPWMPEKAELAGWGGYLGSLIVGGLGSVFSLIGIIYYVVTTLGKTRNTRLRESGQLVQADFVSVDTNSYVKMNNRHPFFIRCQWKDPLTGKDNFFKSGFIWSDPTPRIVAGRKIDVYMDGNNPKKYYVDITPYE